MDTIDYQNILKDAFHIGIQEAFAAVEGLRDVINPTVVLPTLSAAGLLLHEPDVDLKAMARLREAVRYPDVAEMILSWGVDLQAANLLCPPDTSLETLSDNLGRQVELCGLVALMPSGHLPEVEAFLDMQREGLRHHPEACYNLEDTARMISDHLYLPRHHMAEMLLCSVLKVSKEHFLGTVVGKSSKRGSDPR